MGVQPAFDVVELLRVLSVATQVLVFTVAAYMSRTLWKDAPRVRPILYVASFALGVSVADLWRSTAFTQAADDSVGLIYAFVRVLAYALLLRYGLELVGPKTRQVAGIVGIVLFIVWSASMVIGPGSGEPMARLLLGFPAAGLAAYAASRRAKEKATTGMWPAILAALLAAYAVFDGLAAPVLHFSGDASLAGISLPAGLGGGLILKMISSVLLLALGMVTAFQIHELAAHTKADRDVRARVFGVAIVSLALFVAIVGTYQTTTIVGRWEDGFIESVTRRAEVDGQLVEAIVDRSQGTRGYRGIDSYLDVFLDDTIGIDHAYVIEVSSSEVLTLSEARSGARAESHDTPTCIGIAPHEVDALFGGELLVRLSDDAGSEPCISVLAPLRRVGGSVIVFGLDLDAAGWRTTKITYLVIGFGATAFAILGLAAAAWASAVRRRDEDRLAVSETRFRRLFEDAPGPLLVVEPQTHVVRDANSEAAALVGLPIDDLVGRVLDDFEGTSVESLDAVFVRAESQGTTSSPFREMRVADGSVRKTEMHVGMAGFEDGKLAIVSVRDVTAQRFLEDALTERASTLRVVADVATKFVDVSPSALSGLVSDVLSWFADDLDAVRVSRVEVLENSIETHEYWTDYSLPPLRMSAAKDGLDFVDLASNSLSTMVMDKTDVSERFPSIAAFMVDSGASTVAVAPLRRGELVLGLIVVESKRQRFDWRDEDIALVRTVGDIVSSGLARAATESEIARLSTALRQSPVSVFIADGEGAIQWVNPKFEELNGYSLDEISGKDWRMLVPRGAMPPQVLSEMQKTVAAGDVWRGELEAQRKDGSRWWASVTVSALRSNGDVEAFVTVQQDISTQKEVQETLQLAKSAAENANRTKSEFLATMSHEIRTPMNAIIGMSELLAETELSKDQLRYVNTLSSAGEALLDLIDDVLDLSKIEAGKIEIESLPFEPSLLAEEVADVIAVKARTKGLEVLVHVADDIPRIVVGDRHRLRQVLINLLGNAVKFTESGHVLLDLSVDETYDKSDRVRLRAEVTDTGVGIAKDKQARIFEAFTQADSSTTRQYGGSGLGLTISKRIVEMMGGTIGVRSRPGKGSTFAFTVVCDEAPEGIETLEPEARHRSELDGARLLVVDDNPINRMIVKDYLGSSRVHIDEVRSGEEALELLRTGQRTYDAILMDVRMPGLDGYETSRVILEESLGGVPGIVVLTSEDDPRDQAKVKEFGLEDRLLKPLRRSILLEAVSHAVAVSRQRGGAPAEAPSAKEKPKEAPEPGRPLRILLVEDSEDNRFLIEAFLADSGHTLDIAVNGKEAVDSYEKAGDSAYDLVFMDMQMPVMDGYEATSTIREMETERGWSRSPILALTAYALEEEAQRSLAAGCDAHVTKPIRKARLLEAISEYARR